MEYFDYEKMADEIHLTSKEVENICKLVKREYPDDEMLYELHVMRALMAIKKGIYDIHSRKTA